MKEGPKTLQKMVTSISKSSKQTNPSQMVAMRRWKMQGICKGMTCTRFQIWVMMQRMCKGVSRKMQQVSINQLSIVRVWHVLLLGKVAVSCLV